MQRRSRARLTRSPPRRDLERAEANACKSRGSSAAPLLANSINEPAMVRGRSFSGDVFTRAPRVVDEALLNSAGDGMDLAIRLGADVLRVMSR